MTGFLTKPKEDGGASEPTNPNLTDERYKGVAVDTRYTPRKSLITHIAGFRWVIEYYSQYIGKDDEVASQEVNRPSVYQQYLCIHDLEVRVQDPLTSSQDSTSNEFTYTGSALMYVSQVPNKGDMFIADIGDGRQGLFTVTETTQNSIFRDSTYAIEYSLVNYLSEELHNDLKIKTVKEVWFKKDFFAMGRNPFLIKEEAMFAEEIMKSLETMPREYLSQFYNQEHSTLIIPDQPNDTYDAFLTKYISKTMSLDDHPHMLYLKTLNVQDPPFDQMKTFWDALFEMQPRMMNVVSPVMKMFYANKGYQVTNFSSFRLSGIDYLYYHRDVASHIANQVDNIQIEASPEQNFLIPQDLFTALPVDMLQGLPYTITSPMPLIKKVLDDEYYVFSEAFYREDYEEMSVLEMLTWDGLHNKPISFTMLGHLLKQYYYWPNLEKYYYMPVLMFLMRSCFKDIN